MKKYLKEKFPAAHPRRKGMNLQSRISDDDLDFLIQLRDKTGCPLTLLVAEMVNAGINSYKKLKGE